MKRKINFLDILWKVWFRVFDWLEAMDYKREKKRGL
jgi:hypothetical protein